MPSTVCLLQTSRDHAVPLLHFFVRLRRKCVAGDDFGKDASLGRGDIVAFDGLLQERHMLGGTQQKLECLPPNISTRQQSRHRRSLEGTGRRPEGVETAQGFVDVGQAGVGGLEEERVVVTTDRAVKSSQTRRSELGVHTGLEVALSNPTRQPGNTVQAGRNEQLS